METKELRVKVPAALHRQLSIAASKRMLRIGTFTREALIYALKEYEKNDPDGKYYLFEKEKE